MRVALTLYFVVVAGAASAHVGHIGEVAGHGHWIGAAALGLAVLLGLREALKARKDNEAKEADEETEEELDGEKAPA